MATVRQRVQSQWYATSYVRIALWVLGLFGVGYMLVSLGEFVAAAAKAVAP